MDLKPTKKIAKNHGYKWCLPAAMMKKLQQPWKRSSERQVTKISCRCAGGALVTGDVFASVSGEYFDRSTNMAKSSELSYNEQNAAELWDASMRFCGLE